MAIGVFKDMIGKKQMRPSHPLQQVDFNEDLSGMVNDEYNRRQTERMPFELQWRLNLEFIKGNQFIDINPISQTIEEVPKLYWYQEREVFDQLSTIYETRIARLTRQKPILKVRPATGDDADVSRAKISTMLTGASWHEQKMDAAYQDFVSWLEAIGTCFWKPTWNPKKGRIISRGLQPDQGQMKDNPSREDEVNTPESYESAFMADQNMVEIREGDIDTVVASAFEIYPDSSFRNGTEKCRSIIHAKAYHVDEVEDMYGIQVEPEEVDVITLQSGKSGLGGLGYAYGTFRTGTTRIKNHVIVKEYYERPSRKYPHGRLIIVAGSKTLYVGTMPYLIGPDGTVDFPLIATKCVENPGCFWGKTIIERCIPVQRRYNALRNRKAEYLNLVAIGQWYEPINSIDDDTELNNAPGNRIKYRPGPNGERPTPVEFPNLPGSFEKEEASLLGEFTSISGVSELSRYSEAPTGVKSGVALSIANEQDDTRIASTAARIAIGIVQLGICWLRLYRQFVKEPRILRWTGPNREIDVREWFASDLRSDDVIIENMAALSETPSQRRQMIFDLINTGIFNRPEKNPFDEDAKQKVFQLIEMGHWESGAENDDFLQKSRARSENYEILRGIGKPVQDFDDHLIHIQMHNRQRMQEEYDQLLKTPYGPAIDALMRAHIAEHMQAIANEQMAAQAQMQAQIATQGQNAPQSM